MKRLGYIFLVLLIVIVAVTFYIMRRDMGPGGASVSPTPTQKPTFALSGEIVALDDSQMTILFQKRAALSSEDLPEYETRTTPISDTTAVVRMSVDSAGVLTEHPATVAELKTGQDVTVQWSERDGPGLFPQKITILP